MTSSAPPAAAEPPDAVPPPAEERDQPGFQPVSPRRVFEDIVRQIRRALAQGNLRPGDRLPSERELARQFQAGRAAVREALRTLENAGILTFRQGTKGGAFIREAQPERMTQLLADMVDLGGISLESLTDARVHLMTMVVELAAARMTAEDGRTLRAAVDAVEQHTLVMRPQRRQEAIGVFYDLLARSTGNQVLVMLVRSVTEIVRSVVLDMAPRPKGETVATFRGMIEALERGDAAAARELMGDHLRDLHRYLLQARQDRPVPASGPFHATT